MAISATTEKPIHVLNVANDEFQQMVAALAGAGSPIRREDNSVEFPPFIDGVSWKSYQQLLDALGDHRLRHTYAAGRLTMSPRKDHDWVGRFLSRIVQTITLELNTPIQCIGSTTITSEDLERGFEPDEAFYLANEPKVRGKRTFEPNVDPPPDLIIEVDVTSNSEDRLLHFAVMGVPEVWRHEDDNVVIYVLDETGDYAVDDHSHSFPFLAAADLERFVELISDVSENEVVREVIKFVRATARPGDD